MNLPTRCFTSSKQDVGGGICQRTFPKDFPPYKTVYTFYRRAKPRGVWDEILKNLVEKTRIKNGKNANPSYVLIDSQSVKTVYASDETGFDGEKKIKGRKRHIATDIMGNLFAVYVHAANKHDTRGGVVVFDYSYIHQL